jgi:hypothetical protein
MAICPSWVAAIGAASLMVSAISTRHGAPLAGAPRPAMLRGLRDVIPAT